MKFDDAFDFYDDMGCIAEDAWDDICRGTFAYAKGWDELLPIVRGSIGAPKISRRTNWVEHDVVEGL